jgi:F-type H+-transporting ATPase subunit b
MSLVTPGIGLIFWMTLVFIVLLIILKKFAWKPILKSLKEREDKITTSLSMAKQTQEEMKQIKADNEVLLKEARGEREKILKGADEIKNQIISEAKSSAQNEADKIIENARKSIENEKKMAIDDLKKQVAEYSLQIAEMLLNKEMLDSQKEKDFLNEQVDKLHFN